MGVTGLRKIVQPVIEKITFDKLGGRKIAIDAFNHLYQFLATIRQQDGGGLRNDKGDVTSHLQGLFSRTLRLLEAGIKPIYVFDGAPSKLKAKVLQGRRSRREEAERKRKEAVELEDFEGARKYAQAAVYLTQEMVGQAKNLLTAMGVPHIQAASEGEAQAAYLAQKGHAWASGSQDWDSILFGSPRFVRNLNFSGKRRAYGRMIDVDLELVNSKKVFSDLQLSREQLIDAAIMLGTDYNEKFPKVGPKTALKYLQEYGNLENIIKKKQFKLNFSIEEIRALFLSPEIEESYEIKFKPINNDRIIRFLCDQHSFKLERVKSSLNRYEIAKKKISDAKKQQSLMDWM